MSMVECVSSYVCRTERVFMYVKFSKRTQMQCNDEVVDRFYFHLNVQWQ